MAIYLGTSIISFFIAFYLFNTPDKDSLFFRTIEGPEYFQDAWLYSQWNGNFKMKFENRTDADCHVESKWRGRTVDLISLSVLSNGSGVSILVEDEENLLASIEMENPPNDTVYFRYKSALGESQGKCEGEIVRKNGDVLLFEVGTPDKFIKYREGWGVLFIFIGLGSLAGLLPQRLSSFPNVK